MAQCAAAAEPGSVGRCTTVPAASADRRPVRLRAGAGEASVPFRPVPDGTPGPDVPLGCDHDATTCAVSSAGGAPDVRVDASGDCVPRHTVSAAGVPPSASRP